LGADDGGEPNLVYTWTTTATPAGAPAPSFSINGSNAAKTTTATFYKKGSYSFRVFITDSGGLSTSSVVSVNVTSGSVPTIVSGGTATTGKPPVAQSPKPLPVRAPVVSRLSWDLSRADKKKRELLE
jgi:hypothetical protein